MLDNSTPFASLFERAENYGKTTLKLFELKTIDKSADLISYLVSRLAVITTVVLSIIIISIGLALWIGKLLGESFYGFFIVGGFYVIFAIFLHLYREQLVKYPVSNSIIKQLLKEKIV